MVFNGKWARSRFAHAFITITWNLCCRSANTVTIHSHHMEWSQDTLRIYFCHKKNDQSGQRKRDPRHIYANLFDPVVCPIFALSLYLTSFNLSENRNTCLFPGGCQYSRFLKYFNRILIANRDEILTEFGINVDDIGVHSIRKGAGTYLSSGSTAGPSQTAITLRVGCNLPGV